MTGDRSFRSRGDPAGALTRSRTLHLRGRGTLYARKTPVVPRLELGGRAARLCRPPRHSPHVFEVMNNGAGWGGGG